MSNSAKIALAANTPVLSAVDETRSTNSGADEEPDQGVNLK